MFLTSSAAPQHPLSVGGWWHKQEQPHILQPFPVPVLHPCSQKSPLLPSPLLPEGQGPRGRRESPRVPSALLQLTLQSTKSRVAFFEEL